MSVGKINQCNQPLNSPIEALPQEVLTSIFQFIHQNPDGINNFSYVCKQWYIVKLHSLIFYNEQFLINKFLEVCDLQNKFLAQQNVVANETFTPLKKRLEEANTTIVYQQNYLTNLVNEHKVFSLQTIGLTIKSISTDLKSYLLFCCLKYRSVMNSAGDSMKLSFSILPGLPEEITGWYAALLIASTLPRHQQIDNTAWDVFDEISQKMGAEARAVHMDLLRFHALLVLEQEESLKSAARERLSKLTENAIFTAEQLLALHSRNCLPIDSCIAAAKRDLFSAWERRNMAATYFKKVLFTCEAGFSTNNPPPFLKNPSKRMDKAIMYGEYLEKVISLLNTIPEDADNTRSTVLCQLIKKLSGYNNNYFVIDKLLLAIPNKKIKTEIEKNTCSNLDFDFLNS